MFNIFLKVTLICSENLLFKNIANNSKQKKGLKSDTTQVVFWDLPFGRIYRKHNGLVWILRF